MLPSELAFCVVSLGLEVVHVPYQIQNICLCFMVNSCCDCFDAGTGTGAVVVDVKCLLYSAFVHNMYFVIQMICNVVIVSVLLRFGSIQLGVCTFFQFSPVRVLSIA